jgi:hypothetical protein
MNLHCRISTPRKSGSLLRRHRGPQNRISLSKTASLLHRYHMGHHPANHEFPDSWTQGVRWDSYLGNCLEMFSIIVSPAIGLTLMKVDTLRPRQENVASFFVETCCTWTVGKFCSKIGQQSFGLPACLDWSDEFHPSRKIICCIPISTRYSFVSLRFWLWNDSLANPDQGIRPLPLYGVYFHRLLNPRLSQAIAG